MMMLGFCAGAGACAYDGHENATDMSAVAPTSAARAPNFPAGGREQRWIVRRNGIRDLARHGFTPYFLLRQRLLA